MSPHLSSRSDEVVLRSLAALLAELPACVGIYYVIVIMILLATCTVGIYYRIVIIILLSTCSRNNSSATRSSSTCSTTVRVKAMQGRTKRSRKSYLLAVFLGHLESRLNNNWTKDSRFKQSTKFRELRRKKREKQTVK